MSEKQTRSVPFTTILAVLLLAVVVAVLSTLIQYFLLGRSMPIVTGAVVGGVIAGVAFTIVRKKKV